MVKRRAVEQHVVVAIQRQEGVVAPLHSLCLAELVNVIYILQHQQATAPHPETVEVRVQAILSQVPHTSLGAFMMLYQTRCHQPQTSFQSALSTALYASDLDEEINCCRNCGHQEAIDVEQLHEHLVHSLAAVWYIPPDVFAAVAAGLDFEATYECAARDFTRWYDRTMGVHRAAFSATQYLQQHKCLYRYMTGRIQGVRLRAGT